MEKTKWTEGKNSKWMVEGSILTIQVNLAGKSFLYKNEKPMAASCFINHMTETSRIFGNLNLNIGEKKSSLVARSSALEARIKELEGLLSKK